MQLIAHMTGFNAVQMLSRTDLLLTRGRLQQLRSTERAPEVCCWLVRPCGCQCAILHLC